MNPDETEPVPTAALTVCFSLLHIPAWTLRGHTRLHTVLTWAWQLRCDLANEYEPSLFHMIVSWLLHFFCTVTQTTQELVWRILAAAPHRMLGGDFLQWPPQKTGGRDYDKSLFHAPCGLSPSLQFPKSISGIIDTGASMWVDKPRCMLWNFKAASQKSLLSYPPILSVSFFSFSFPCPSNLSFKRRVKINWFCFIKKSLLKYDAYHALTVADLVFFFFKTLFFFWGLLNGYTVVK